MSAVNHPSSNPLHEHSSGISYSSLFGFLISVLLLFAFCFLPWLSTIVNCNTGDCGGAALLQPANPTGLMLAAGDITTHEVVAHYDLGPGYQPNNIINLHIPPLPESQVSLPFLWIFPVVSLLMMLISLTNLLRRSSRDPQENVTNLLLLGTLLITVLFDLFYMGSLSSAFSTTSDALAHMTFQTPYNPPITLILSTIPDRGFWVAVLILLIGSGFFLSAWWEERPGRLMYSLGHLESVFRLGTFTRLTYRLFPLNITRPRRGISKTPLVCPVCHKSFTLRVLSKPTHWLYRSLWIAGLTAFFFLAPPSEFVYDIFFTDVLFVSITIFLCFIAMDGIGLDRFSFFNRGHILRRGKRSLKEI